MTVTRRRRVLATAVAVAVVAGGCAIESADELRPAPAGAVVGGTVEVAMPGPASIDPGNAFEPMGTMIARLMCDTLLDVDRETGELVPGLAESWRVLDDGRRIVLRLREGVRMHDGTELTGDDVVFAISRAASAAFAGQAAELLAPIDGFAIIRGQEESEIAQYRERLRGVRVFSSRTVEIHLPVGAPLADLVRLFTHPVTAPISREAAEADPEGFASQPVCAGPYRPRAPWEPGDDGLTLERFEDYHASNPAFTRGGAGYADQIRFTFVDDPRPELPDPAASDATAGHSPELPDAAPTTVPTTDLTPAPAAGEGAAPPSPAVAPPAALGVDLRLLGPGDDAPPGRRVASGVGPSVDYLGLPTATFPRDVRVALSQALDREAIAESFGGERAPATGFLPPTVGAETFRDGACPSTVPAAGDVEAARATLRAGGHDLGSTMTIAFNDELLNRELVDAVAGQWEDAFELTVRREALSWSAFLERGTSVSGFDVPFRLSWSAAYPSADEYLFPLFHTAGSGRANLGGFSDPALDERFEDAREATESADRALVHQDIEDRLCETVPMIPVTFDVVRWAVGDDVAAATPWVVDPITAEPPLREIFRTEG